MAKINLTDKVKELTLTKAINVALNSSSCNDEENAKKLLSSLLKLKALAELIDPAVANAEKVLSAFVKKGDDLSANAEMKRANAAGEIENINVNVDITKKVINKESIDSESLKNDLGVAVTEDDNNPNRVVVEINDAKHWPLFKAVSVAVNPTAINAAINNGSLDKKYKINKPQNKIVVETTTKVI